MIAGRTPTLSAKVESILPESDDRRAQLSIFADSLDYVQNLLTQNDTEFAYDALDRLTSWYDPARDATTTYTYDPVGNLTEVQEEIGGTVVTRSFTYNAAANKINNSTHQAGKGFWRASRYRTQPARRKRISTSTRFRLARAITPSTRSLLTTPLL